MSQYHYGMKKVPKPIGSAEWESFKKFAKNYYRDAVEIARASVDGDLTHPLNQLIFKQILDKAASPLVYIWEEWQLLGSEDRLKYATEDYRKQLEAQIKAVHETEKKAEQLGFAKKEEVH